MKKKLIIFMPSIEGGGVEKNLFIVSNYLGKKLGKIAVISASLKYKNKFTKNINFIGPESKFWDLKSRRTKYFICLFFLLKQIINNKNILVFAFQANIYCIIICKLFGIKIITRSNSAPAGWSKNIIKKLVFRYFLNVADLVIANSQEFVQSLKKEFNLDALCIYNPLDINNIVYQSSKNKKKYFKTKKIKILNIGRFTDQKDQITLIKSLNEIKNRINFEAIIVGRGILKKQIKLKIDEYKLNNKIKILNFMQNPYPIMKESDLFILTSKYEGLPNVLLEALTLKKFIISSDCETGPKEILSNGKGGLLFKVGDYKTLARKIVFFIQNKKKLTKKTKFGYKNLKRFDYYKNLHKYFVTVNRYLN
jgi:glycosyltransferase involved in cell wall biosynthesis